MKKKMTAHSITLKHKHAEKHMKRKGSEFTKNRREEEMEDEGKKKHYKHEKMACKHCKSTSHMSSEHHKHMKKKAATSEHNKALRYENMRRKVFGLKKV